MAVEGVLTDQKTRDKLGVTGLAALSQCLWAVDCQSCGQAFGDETPALCVDDLIAYAAAGLHHRRCRPPQWKDIGVVRFDSSAAMLSYACRLVMMPFSKGDQPDPRPMLLVNPGLEMVIIQPDDQQRWQVRPNAAFSAAGLVPPGPDLVVDRPIPGAVARLTTDSVAVAMQASSAMPVFENGTAASDEPFRVRIRELGGLLLGVTHALHPHQVDWPDLDDVLRSGQILLGWVALHGHKPATARPESTTTYVLHWSGGHAFVGPLLADSTKKMTSIKARSWAGRIIGSSDRLLPWEPVAAGSPDDGWYTLDAISVKQYVLLQHPDGWTLLEALSRMDSTGVIETDNEAKAWAASVLQARARPVPLTWEPRPSRPGANTLYAGPSTPIPGGAK